VEGANSDKTQCEKCLCFKIFETVLFGFHYVANFVSYSGCVALKMAVPQLRRLVAGFPPW
jgi:hypothetical protein